MTDLVLPTVEETAVVDTPVEDTPVEETPVEAVPQPSPLEKKKIRAPRKQKPVQIELAPKIDPRLDEFINSDFFRSERWREPPAPPVQPVQPAAPPATPAPPTVRRLRVVP